MSNSYKDDPAPTIDTVYRDYSPLTVGQLVSQLATLPPMMPIFGGGASEENKYFFNGLSVDDSSVTPVLLLRFSAVPEALKRIPVSYEELVDWKREQGRQMTYESHIASLPTDQRAQ